MSFHEEEKSLSGMPKYINKTIFMVKNGNADRFNQQQMAKYVLPASKFKSFPDGVKPDQRGH